MISPRMVGPALALVAAAGCTVVSSHRSAEPAPRPAPRRASTAATLGVPPGHLPPPGRCRVWIPGQPPGHQAKARSCARIERYAPAGSWILYRPTSSKHVVEVRMVDRRRPGVVVQIKMYDVRAGTEVRGR